MKVLIAEDDNVTRRILQLGLERLGHECICASNGREAWELFLKERNVEVIISDRMMPEMDGIELCRRVRQLQSDRYIYFVFITALGERDNLLEGLEAGADDYLTKPLDQQQLKARLLTASRVTALHNRLHEQKRQLEHLNRELWYAARQDPLTKLGNRLRLREDLESLLAQMDRYGYTYCAMLCDIDNFKDYNDHYGHLAGDEVLKKVSEAILGDLRKGDRAYRYGGEEFLITLPEQTFDSARIAAERLRNRIETLSIPHEARPDTGVVTVSIGLSELRPEHDKSVEAFLREADGALYRAKSLGKNRVMANDLSAPDRKNGR
ncbi:GGDEF: diguanylate cyclase (GGDEF) domain [Rubrobacter radiotolerans]|uniref:Diguanylate cyclase n=1 Tax=Rubrobacter radiotolerans TaxID=42256 RepID=A0A023X5U4_RUBRA|nr:diguanylate cyclase [Rubrobacter radiotolerans]AHY47708.1 GGDEF: diguanylate cyclase (GGDEF) domain [Rubrobacter radiotolerans]MDX5895111.1 diguanylate cyclase [Rubrobacter radiotolerans]SMC07473.1 diguanylate cyclase (GGDEF) domain-containing protein [Rubrobacter radiotolerans DSM 5868]